MTPGSNWMFLRALWISLPFRAKISIPLPFPPASEIRPVHGSDWLTRRARAFRIPNGAVGSDSIASESLLRDSSANLGIAAFTSV